MSVNMVGTTFSFSEALRIYSGRLCGRCNIALSGSPGAELLRTKSLSLSSRHPPRVVAPDPTLSSHEIGYCGISSSGFMRRMRQRSSRVHRCPGACSRGAFANGSKCIQHR